MSLQHDQSLNSERVCSTNRPLNEGGTTDRRKQSRPGRKKKYREDQVALKQVKVHESSSDDSGKLKEVGSDG